MNMYYLLKMIIAMFLRIIRMLMNNKKKNSVNFLINKQILIHDDKSLLYATINR